MLYNTHIHYNDITLSLDDTQRHLTFLFTCLAAVLIPVAIYIGNPNHLMTAALVCISCIATLFFGHYERSWIILATILIANPDNWLELFPCNLVYALWLMVFKHRYVYVLPRWIYITAGFAFTAFVCSSTGWTYTAANVTMQALDMLAWLMGPIILLPLIYFRMAWETSTHFKVKTLLFYLIIPSTLILITAYSLGTPIRSDVANEMHLEVDFQVIYLIWHTKFDFIRTSIGFILSSLICASTALILLRITPIIRVLAAICLTINLFLLIVTASIGSIVACICGLAFIFIIVAHRISLTRSLLSIATIIFVVFLVWSFSPPRVQDYVVEHYQDRIANSATNVDRLQLWGYAVNYISEHPLGGGWSDFTVYGDKVKRIPHNDYLAYSCAYGVMGGLVYAFILLRLLVYFIRKAKTLSSDPYAMSITLSGLGVVSVVLINSICDHMTANPWFFNLNWAIIWYAYFSGYPHSERGTAIPAIE